LEKFAGKHEIDDVILGDINTTLRYRNKALPDKMKLSISNGMVVIPAELFKTDVIDIKIDPSMRGLMKKDKEGNILLDPRTPLRFLTRSKTHQSKDVLNIGADITKDGALSPLDLDSSRFTDADIDTSRLPSFEGKAKLTSHSFLSTLSELKGRNSNDSDLQTLNLKFADGGIILPDDTVLDLTDKNFLTIAKNEQNEFVYTLEKKPDYSAPLTIKYIDQSLRGHDQVMEI
jgi:hypothetical protein